MDNWTKQRGAGAAGPAFLAKFNRYILKLSQGWTLSLVHRYWDVFEAVFSNPFFDIIWRTEVTWVRFKIILRARAVNHEAWGSDHDWVQVVIPDNGPDCLVGGYFIILETFSKPWFFSLSRKFHVAEWITGPNSGVRGPQAPLYWLNSIETYWIYARDWIYL